MDIVKIVWWLETIAYILAIIGLFFIFFFSFTPNSKKNKNSSIWLFVFKYCPPYLGVQTYFVK